LLPLGLSGRVKVARAGVLLTVKKTSVEYTVIIISLSLIAMNYFVEPACAGVLLTCVTARNTMSKWSKDRSGANVSYQTHRETFFRSDLTPRSSLI
jgi:hypothetical protein